MRRPLVTTAALALLSAPGHAGPLDAPGEALANFRSLCVAHRGEPSESLKAAAAAGWMPVPKRYIEDRQSGLPNIDGDARMKSTRTEIEMLLAGRTQLETDGRRQVDLKVCLIATGPAPQPGLEKAVEDWAGVAPFDIQADGSRLYMFTEEDGRHLPVAGPIDRQLTERLAAGAVSLVAVNPGKKPGDGTFVAYGVVTLVEET